MITNQVNQITLELANHILKIGESVVNRLKATGGHQLDEVWLSAKASN